MGTVRRKLGILAILGAVALPMAIVSVAYACGVLATLYFHQHAVNPGASVSGFGGNYNSAPTASPVVLHFNGRTGRVLWSGHPDLNGTIRPAFQAPRVRPGYYLVDAMQTTPKGSPSPGTPGRAVLRIGHPSKHGAVAVWPSATPGTGVGASATSRSINLAPGTAVLVSLLSAGMLAGGVLLLRGDPRRRRVAPAA